MTTTYTVGAKIIINYDQSEIKTTIERLQNFVKANPITISNIKIDSTSLNNIKTNLEKMSIKLDNVSINNIKIPSNTTKELKSKIESISFKLGNLKLDTSKIDGKKIDISLRVPNSEITKLKQQIEGLRPVIKVQVQGQNTVATPGSGSLAQAKTFADSLTTAGQYKGNTIISYDYDQAGKLIAVLKNAQNETIRLKYQFDEASKSFQQIGSSTKVPDLLNQSTIAAQKTFSDLKNITTQFNVLKQQSGSNPIDFKTQKLVPDLEMLNAKLKTLSTGMQQVTQTYKLNDTQTMSVSGNYNMLRGQMDSLSTSTGNLANRQIGLGEATSVALQRFPLWIAVSTLVMSSLHKLSESFEFMSGQSKLFTNLQLEMSDTNLVFSEITNTANKFATEMGATTDTVMKAIAVFGTYTSTIDEVLTKSRSAVTLSSITGQGIEQTSDELMGVMTQYRLTANEITGVTDSILGAARMLQLDFPKGVAEISSGLRTVGSVAKDAGLNIAETTGILSTMIEVTRRSGSENANALRTVISRISNVGEESNPEEFKGIEKKFNDIGVAIKSSSDTILPMGNILSNLSEKWKVLNDVERQSIATAAAGIYRRNAFISLMTNYDKVLQNTTAAQESEGVTAQKQEIYNNSLAASVQRLTSAWELFYLNSINTDTWKNMVDGLTVVISGFAKFADVIGGIPTILSTVVLTASLFSTKFQGFMSRSFLIAPMLAFKASVLETAVVMRQFSGYANTWRANPFIVGFEMAKTSVLSYITSIRLATVQQTAMGRTGWANALGVAITGINTAMRSLTTSTIAARVAMSAFQAVSTLGLSVALMFIIGKVMNLADSWIHADEKAKEAFDTLTKSIQSLKQETSELPSLISSYEELFDKLGKTTEEKEELATTTAKLSALFGDSVIQLDSEGKAIEVDIEYVKQLTQAKKDLLIVQQQELASKFESMGKDQYDEILTKQNRIKEINAEITKQNDKIANLESYDNANPDDVIGITIDNKRIESYKKTLAELSIERTKLTGESSEIQKTLSQEAYAFDQSTESSNKLSQSLINNLSKATFDSGKGFNDLLSVMGVFSKSDVSEVFKRISEDMTKGTTTEKAKEDIKDMESALNKYGVEADIATKIIKYFNNAIKLDNAPETITNLKDMTVSSKELADSLKDVTSVATDVSKAMEEYNETGKLSASTIVDLVTKYPELIDQLKVENGQLTLNKEAVQGLLDVRINGMITALEAEKTFTTNQAEQTKVRISNLIAEAEAIRQRNNALNALPTFLSKPTLNPSTGTIWLNEEDKIRAEANALQSQLNADNGVDDKINAMKALLGNIKSAANSGSYNPYKKEKDDKSQELSIESTTQALITQIQQEYLLQKAKSDSIQKDLTQAQSQKDYAKTLELTNSLIASQRTEMELLQTARSKINQLKDSAISTASSQFGNVSDRWFIGNDNQKSASFIEEHNKASEDTRKIMDETFDSLQLLRNAWMSNKSSMEETLITQKAFAKQSREDLIKSLEEQSQALSSSETSKLDQSFQNLDIELWIKKNVSATKTWAETISELQEELSKLGNPTTLEGQKKFNELMVQSAKLAADAKKAEDEYAKSVDKMRQEKLFESTDANLQEIMDKIDAVDQEQQLSKGGISSAVPKIDMEIVPRIDYKTVQEAIDEIPKPNEDLYSYKPPLSFVEFINNEFTNAVSLANTTISDLKSKITALGAVTPENKDQILSYYKQIQDQVQTLSDVAKNAQDSLQLKLSTGEISQEDFNNKMQAIQSASIEVLAIPKIQITAEATEGINKLQESMKNIVVDADTKLADDKLLALISKNYETIITANLDDIAAQQAILMLQQPTSSIHTIYVQTAEGEKPEGFAKGTNSSPSGLAIISEKGRELIKLPNGSIYLSGDNGAELVNLPEGTQITPNSETEKILKSNNGKIPAYADGTGSHVTDMDFLNSSAKEFSEAITDLTKVISKSSKLVDADNKAVENSNKKIDKFQAIIDKYSGSEYAGSRKAERKVESAQRGLDKEASKNEKLVTKAESDQAILDTQNATRTDYTQKLIATQKAMANLNSSQYIEQKIDLYQEAITVASTNIDKLYESIAKYQNDDGTYQDNATTRDVLGKIKSYFEAEKSAQLSIKQLVKERFEAEYEGFEKVQKLEEDRISYLQKTLDYQKLIGASVEDQLATEQEILKSEKGEQSSLKLEKVKAERDKKNAKNRVKSDLALVDPNYTEADLNNALANSEEYQLASDKLDDVNSRLLDTKIAISQTVQDIANLDLEKELRPMTNNLEKLDLAEKLLDDDDLQGKLDNAKDKLKTFVNEQSELQDQIDNIDTYHPEMNDQEKATFIASLKSKLGEVKVNEKEIQDVIAQTYQEIANLNVDNLLKPMTDDLDKLDLADKLLDDDDLQGKLDIANTKLKDFVNEQVILQDQINNVDTLHPEMNAEDKATFVDGLKKKLADAKVSAKEIQDTIDQTLQDMDNLNYTNLLKPFKDTISNLEVLLKLLDENDFAGSIENIGKQMEAESSVIDKIKQKIAETIADTSLTAEDKSEKLDKYSTDLNEAELAMKGLIEASEDFENKTLAKAFNTQYESIEKTIFNGSTEQEAQDALNQRIALQDKYLDGAEKDLEIGKIRTQIQSEGLILTAEQTALLNTQGKIEKSSIERLQKQLDIQQLQLKVQNLMEQKTIQQMTKNADGTWDFTYVADQTAIDQAQEELANKRIELINFEEDQVNTADQNALSEKSKYLNKVKAIMDKAQNGEYASMEEFTNAMSTLNQEYLGGMGLENSTEWNNIYNATQTNLNNISSAYSTYVGNMESLAEKAKQAYKDIFESQNSITTVNETAPVAPVVVADTSTAPVVGNTSNTAPEPVSDEYIPYTPLDVIAVNTTVVVSDTSNSTVDNTDNLQYGQSNPNIRRKITGSYAEGGVSTETGLAMLHGTPSSSEVIFNSGQAKKLYDLVKSIPNGFDLSKIPMVNMLNNFKPLDIASNLISKTSQSVSNTFNIDKLEFPNIKSGGDVDLLIQGLNSYAIQYSKK